MRIVSRSPLLGAAAALAVAFFVCQPVHAQSDFDYHATKPLPKATLRIGAMFPEDSVIETQIGRSQYAAGLDYYLNWDGPSTAYLMSVDYISRLTNTVHDRLVPVTFGVIHYYSDTQQTNRFYSGAGLGVYFDDLQYVDDYGFTQAARKTLYGGYLEAGVDLSQTFVIDARYHYVSNILNRQPGGLELTAGIHF